MKKAGFLPGILAIAVMATGCDEEVRKKIFGEICAEDSECESGDCHEGRCVSWGDRCSSLQECDDSQECSLDECSGDGHCRYRVNLTLSYCVPVGETQCACDDEGVRIIANGCTWSDATECSGWHSVQMAQGRPEETQFRDGTTLCMEDCCLTIDCP